MSSPSSRTKRICVDARPLAFPGTGNARYLEKMLEQMIHKRPEYEWILASHRAIHPRFAGLVSRPGVHLRIERGILARNGLLWINTRLPSLVREEHADLFWGTIGMLPLFARKRLKVPSLVNFHDLNAFTAPETMERWNRIQHRVLDGPIIAQADLVACLSETTKKDILATFPGIEESRLVVVYPGVESGTDGPEESPFQEGSARESTGGMESFPGGPFLLTVGTLEPRKNLELLVGAYREARKADGNLWPLVLVGKKGWGSDELHRQLVSRKLEKEGIYFLEGPSDAVLRWCYRKAALLVIPSVHEGFGLPIIEAGLYGKRVLASRIPVFQEIVEDPGRLVDARDPSAWKEALLGSRELAKGKSPLNPREWSWEHRSEKLLELLDRLVK